MKDLKTVEENQNLQIHDPNLNFQKEAVERMRTSLLSCTIDSNSKTATAALQQIAIMRIYHQVSRVIKYLDLMDKLESKLYESIEASMDTMATANPSTWAMLLRIQSQLQYNMVQSQKLLEPYMNMDTFHVPDFSADNEYIDADAKLIPQESREKLRNTAQAILTELNSSTSGGDTDESSS